MARKPIQNAEGASMDSLMDTLTNVVGILVFILILSQINMARQVKKIVSDLPPATAEDVAALRAQIADANADLDRIRADIRALEEKQNSAASSLEAAAADIARVEADLKKVRQSDVDLNELFRVLREAESAFEGIKTEVTTLMAERDRLEALLAQTPVPRAPGPKIIRIPASRPIPEKARVEHFFITGKKVYHLDSVNVITSIEREIQQAKQSLTHNIVRLKGKADKIIFDQEKIAERFKTRAPKPRDVIVTVPLNKPWTGMNVAFLPRPDGGEPVEQAAKPGSRFHATINAMATSTVVYFHVTRESFAEYLALREVVDRRNMPAGWEIQWKAEYRELMRGFEVNRLEEPPKPAPGAAPSIPGPKRALD